MRASHVILKVEQLDRAVREYRERGFAVEYGRRRNPINALIYFSEGPYLELLDGTRMPAAVKAFMRVIGKKALSDRLQRLDNCEPGYCELALENYKDNLDEEIAILKKHGIESYGVPSRRVDTHGRDLRFRLAVPKALDVPFLMTYFSIDPKPANFVHPNGIREISRVSYGTDPSRFAVIEELCDDERLKLTTGRGIEVEFGREGAHSA